MPIYATWAIEGELIYTKSWGSLTADDIPLHEQQMLELLDTSVLPVVHTLADHSGLEQLPSLQDLSKIKVGQHPKAAGWYVIVGQVNPLIRLVLSVAVQVLRVKVRFFPTFDEGVSFLHDMAPNLSPDPIDEKTLDEKIAALHAANERKNPTQ
jgi:hypothetical protein